MIDVSSFLLLWFLLNQISWVDLFEVKKNGTRTEEKLGELYWKSIKSAEIEVSNKFILNSVDSIIEKICLANDIDVDKIKVHVLQNSEVNAFALPGGHMIIYTGLIAQNANQDAVTGVICHELAHLELNHVMKKLVKEVGLSVLLSSTAGGGGEVIKETGKLLSSLAFDRSLEKEADVRGVKILTDRGIDPSGFLDLFERLKTGSSIEVPEFLASHPDLDNRIAYIKEMSKGAKPKPQPALDAIFAQLKL